MGILALIILGIVQIVMVLLKIASSPWMAHISWVVLFIPVYFAAFVLLVETILMFLFFIMWRD